MGDERRGHRRQEWTGSGYVLLGRSGRTVPCVILDVTGAGARIELPTQRLMPAEFDLVAEAAMSFRSRVVWADGLVMGIAFDAWPPQERHPNVVRIRAA